MLYKRPGLCKATACFTHAQDAECFTNAQVFSPARCEASASPKVAVGLSAVSDFSREGEAIYADQYLGRRGATRPSKLLLITYPYIVYEPSIISLFKVALHLPS